MKEEYFHDSLFNSKLSTDEAKITFGGMFGAEIALYKRGKNILVG